MKKKAILIITILVLVAVAVVAVGCDKNKASNFTVTLVNGDTTTSFSAAAGADIVDKLAVADTDEEYFGGWYYDAELTQAEDLNGKMPSNNVTLYASWVVKYAVEVYLQPVGLSTQLADYELSETYTVRGAGKKGSSVTVATPEVQGFNLYSGAAGNIQLSGKDNVKKVYYNRNSYLVSFSANLPSGVEFSGAHSSVMAVYGQSYTLPENPYTVSGYRFLGWQRSTGGDTIAAGQQIEVEGDTRFNAVWERGYVDRFDTADELYIDGNAVALLRGGMEFVGDYDSSDKSFEITVGETTLQGKLFDDYTFAYNRGDMAGTYKYRDKYYQQGVLGTETLWLDGVANAVYTDAKGEVRGLYSYDANGEVYRFIASEGSGAGHGFFFVIDEQNDTYAAMGEEAGVYAQFEPYENPLAGFGGDYLLSLDGFGEAVLYDSYHREYYDAVYNVERFVLAGGYAYKINLLADDFDGWLFMHNEGRFPAGQQLPYTFYCMTDATGNTFFTIEDASVVGEYTEKGGSRKLKINDGFGGFGDIATNESNTPSAEYTDANNNHYNGSYILIDTEVFGKVIAFTVASGAKTYYFDIADDGEKSFSEVTSFTERWLLIQDPERASGHPLFLSPILVLFDEAAGDGKPGKRADVYLRHTEDDGYTYTNTLAATGHYTVQTTGDYEVYTFVRDEILAEQYSEDVFSEVVFLVNLIMSENEEPMKCYYVYESDGVNYYTEFKEYDADDNLVATYYTVDIGLTTLGSFKVSGSEVVEGGFNYGATLYEYRPYFPHQYGYFRTADGDISYFDIYEEPTDEGGEFKMRSVSRLPAGYQDVDENNSNSGDETLILGDGVGYFLFYANEEVAHAVKGGITSTKQTVFGDDVFTFTPDADTVSEQYPLAAFDFVIENNFRVPFGGGFTITAYHRYFGEAVGDRSISYTSKIGRLTLDGYNYRARFESADGNSYMGHAYKNEDDPAGLSFEFDGDNGETFYFDHADTSITLRDKAYGVYELMDHNSFSINNLYVFFDGYSAVSLGNYGADDAFNASATGTYRVVDESAGIYHIDINAPQEISYSLETVRIYSGSISICVPFATDVVGKYVGVDGSIMYLDGYNFESYYISPLGVRYEGMYYTFTATRGAYQLLESGQIIRTFAFEYDAKAGTYRPVNNGAAMQGKFVSQDFKQQIDIGADSVSFGRKDGEIIATQACYFITSQNAQSISAITYAVSDNETHFDSYDLRLRGDELSVAVQGSSRSTKYYRVSTQDTLSFAQTGATLQFKLGDMRVDEAIDEEEFGKLNAAAKLNQTDVIVCQYFDFTARKTTFYIGVKVANEGDAFVYFEITFSYSATEKTFDFANKADSPQEESGQTVVVAAKSAAVGKEADDSYTLVVLQDGTVKVLQA